MRECSCVLEHTCVCVHVRMQARIYMYMYVYKCIRMSVHECARIFLNTYVYVRHVYVTAHSILTYLVSLSRASNPQLM